jgi:hypothetical protein
LESFQVAQRIEWYEKNADFRALRDGGTRLMLSMKTLAKAIG